MTRERRAPDKGEGRLYPYVSAGRATSLQNNLVAVSPSFSMVSAFRSKILTTDSPAPLSGTVPVAGGGVDICGDVSAFDCVVGERGIDESISVAAVAVAWERLESFQCRFWFKNYSGVLVCTYCMFPMIET